VQVPYEQALGEVLRWLDTGSSTPTASERVPGPNCRELERLGALGGLVSRVLVSEGLDHYLPAVEQHVAVKEWLASVADPPAAVVEACAVLLRQDSEEGLAGVYAGAVSSANRRRLGTFFTPAPEVTQMLDAWDEIGPTPTSVVDVGAGVGIFTMSAAERWPSAVIHAVDINPITLGLLALRAAHLGKLPATDGRDRVGEVRLEHADYVEFARNRLDELPGPRLVLGNPPYTRMQLLPAEERQRLIGASAQLCGSRSSLSAVITAISLNHLQPGDGLCLLLPAQWLESDYARSLRDHIWKLTRRDVRLHMFGAQLFPEAQVDAVSLVVGPQQVGPRPFMVSDQTGAREVGPGRTESTPRNWRALFSVATTGNTADAANTARLADVAVVRRGVATGSNGFFAITDEVRRRGQLPESVLAPLVRRLKDHGADVITAATLGELPVRERRWLLVCPPRANRAATVLAYLRLGQGNGVAQGVLCSQRQVWHDLSPELGIPDVIVGPATTTRFRFVQNEARAQILNNLYGLKWRSHVTQAQRERVLEWLRSDEAQDAISRQARSQGSGLLKIEPRALQQLAMPAEITGPEAPPGP